VLDFRSTHCSVDASNDEDCDALASVAGGPASASVDELRHGAPADRKMRT
jgi:hypothetical protein